MFDSNKNKICNFYYSILKHHFLDHNVIYLTQNILKTNQGLLVYIPNFTKISKLHRVGKGKSKAFVTKIAIRYPLKGHVHSSSHAHLSKCCFSAGTCCIIYASNNYDHVIMLSKNQSAHSPSSHLINYLCANSFKLTNHGIKPLGQQ